MAHTTAPAQAHTYSARGGRGRRGRQDTKAKPQHQATRPLPSPERTTVAQEQADANLASPTPNDTETAVCWICAEPVKYYSISECDHRTCHVCALRLRALYRKMECAFCKAPQVSVIFTSSPEALFASFTPDRIPYKDQKLSICFETKELMEETLILLRYNCPDPTCDYNASGWHDLKLHVRAIHHKSMCDLCIRAKRVFSHEHILYTSNQLALHLPTLRPSRLHKPQLKEQIEGGVHPLCEFCHESFFDDDELFSHMRVKHEECFLCKRNNIRDQYFNNYESLEKHFHTSHYPCAHPECLAQKFVVFNSTLDLKAHMVEEHGAGMTSRDKKDARRIQADFEFEEINLPGRFPRLRRGGDGEPERELSYRPSTPPLASSSGSRPNGSRRREGFGATLTLDGNRGTGSGDTTWRPPDLDFTVGERRSDLIMRLRSLDLNHSTLERAVEAAIRSFSSSESTARDLILIVWNISNQSMEDTAAAINAIVDYLEEEDKKRALLGSWNGFKIEQRQQFPDLVPTGFGTGYAEITSGRVLNAKHSTVPRAPYQSSRNVWDRVAQAASSTPVTVPVRKPPDRSQPLQPIPGPAPVPIFRQTPRNTPWASSSASAVRLPPQFPSVSSQTDTRSNGQGPLSVPRASSQASMPEMSSASFPELPTAIPTRPKVVVKGNSSYSAPVASAWARAGSGDAGSTITGTEGDSAPDVRSSGSGTPKKGKGKQKQTLFTIGTFPG